MARIDELRLLTKVARLYHCQGLRQTEIVSRLKLSQSTISRLLKRAENEGIVRITVSVPSGTHPELEEALLATFGLQDVIVVDSEHDDDRLVRDLGAAAAFFLETNVKAGSVIGISSWSTALLAMVDAMRPAPRATESTVVQILGGLGNPGSETHATHLTRRLANLLGGKAVLLPAPGVLGSPAARDVLLKDCYVQEALEVTGRLNLALVGIGSHEPERMAAMNGSIFSPRELKMLSAAGAVGDICLRFFDARGQALHTTLDERVIGMALEDLRKVERVVGVAGGLSKRAAILGALRGGWVNVLITDRRTAEALLEPAEPNQLPSV
jgi:DNA-binding transcriptional regulator LsrR (DeoR family)